MLHIKSIVIYWTGPVKKKVKKIAMGWMPIIEDAVPLNVISPNMEMVVFQPPGVHNSDE